MGTHDNDVIAVEWDHQKNQANIRKHGIDFDDAISIFDSDTMETIDDRFEYGEERIVALGEMDGHILVVVYTQRDDVIRIISAREAERHERNDYYSALTGRSPDG